MKSPKNMTLCELAALPAIGVDGSRKQAADRICENATAYGGRFQDDDGFVWDTCKIDGAWVRFPTILSLYFKPLAVHATEDARRERFAGPRQSAFAP